MTDIGTGVRLVEVAEAAGQRVDNFLIRELPGVPKSHIYRMLRRGEVRVNGGRVKATHRLSRGDVVRVPPVRQQERNAAVALPDQLKRVAEAILFEDDDLLVLNKPAGLAVHGGSGIAVGAIEALRQLRRDTPLELAHRLDRDTSGCLVVAKSRQALLEVHKGLRDRDVKKRYAVLVHGRWPRRLRTVRLPLYKYVTVSGERRVRVADEGKASRTDFEVVKHSPAVSYLHAFPHTGRTHQIRVHAFASGHSVVGDDKYHRPDEQAAAAIAGVRRLCLHAEELTFMLGGERRRFACPPPGDFLKIWDRLSQVPDQAAR